MSISISIFQLYGYIDGYFCKSKNLEILFRLIIMLFLLSNQVIDIIISISIPLRLNRWHFFLYFTSIYKNIKDIRG